MKRGKPLARRTPLRRTGRLNPRNTRRKGRRFPKGRDDAFLGYVVGLRCCVCRMHGPSHPHHVRTRGAGGPDQGNLVPLCALDHWELHHIGRKTFAAKHGVDLAAIARRTWAGYRRGLQEGAE